jgi:hypothetical protein
MGRLNQGSLVLQWVKNRFLFFVIGSLALQGHAATIEGTITSESGGDVSWARMER